MISAHTVTHSILIITLLNIIGTNIIYLFISIFVDFLDFFANNTDILNKYQCFCPYNGSHKGPVLFWTPLIFIV